MKSSIKFKIALVLVSVVLLGLKFIDDDFLKRLKEKLANFTKTYGEERIYVQFDKTLYKPGESIWYKAYLLEGSTLAPSPVSNVIYVELIDPRGSVIKKSELFVEEGTSHGDFSLDKSIAGGLYTIKAYTRWMQNFPGENFFSKQITVQSVITPRLLLKLDFEKKAYGKNDFVSARLKARSLKDEPLKNAEIKAQLKLEGKESASQNFVTDEKGEANIVFQLPGDLTTSDGIINVLVSSDGVEESITRSVPIVLNKIQLRFFPEGGDAIAGAKGRIAFKAVNEFGKGADVAGIITDENGNTVSNFESFHFGMGAFELNAEKGHRYQAKIVKPEGINEVYSLPEVKPSGLALALLSKSDSSLQARIYSSDKAEVFLVGHVHSKIYYAEKLSLLEGWNEKIISTKSLPAGIAVFTLFNSEGAESCERLLFINRNKTLHIELATDRKEYLPGEQVELTIKTSDESGAPIPANLSLAVVDDQLLTAIDDKQDNLLSWMLMSSELKGKIEEPYFYFDDTEPKSKQAIDYLLMVHGWRRFTWKEIFSENKTLAFLPENNSNLGGLTLNHVGKNTKAEVVLMEIGNRKRIAKVKSDGNGQFLFRNIDASTPILLLTKRPNTIEVNGMRATIYTERFNYFDGENRWANALMEIDQEVDSPPLELEPGGDVSVSLSTDVTQLSEVVVTGFGIESSKKMLGISTTTVRNLPDAFITGASIESALQGRVAGVMITPTGAPGASVNIQIRGVNSLSNRSEPLWVIDGVPLAGSINSNFAIGSQLNPGNIKSVHILKATEASTLFGSAAANGVILIETKSRLDNFHFNYVKKIPKYSILSIQPRQYTLAREFYTDVPTKNNEPRKNFSSTVLWSHSIVTDKKGEAKIRFYNNDAVSAFRITAEGITGNGLIGRKESTYHTLLPFSLDTKIPNYLGFEDTLKLPIRITNNAKSKLSGKLLVTLPDGLKSIDATTQEIEVDENQTMTSVISVTSTGIAGAFPLKVRLEAGRHKDEVSNVINVHPVGFPVYASYSGRDLNKMLHINIKDLEKGSLKGELVFVTDALGDLFTSAESMLREPHGCFEQVSSSTFPNILALQLLKQTGTSNRAAEERALDLIKSGYKMLKGYEIDGGGFEWFGHPAAHEALSAFGLIEFKEMQKVYEGVDERMMKRTKDWLLTRRRGDGTFIQDHGKYGFSSAPAEVNNAYIVYALSEIGEHDIEMEYKNSLTEANGTKDMYLSALMANAAINFGKMDDFRALSLNFKGALDRNGFNGLKMKSSITYSYGNSLTNETLSLWALALMKAPQPDFQLIKNCVDYIGSKKSFGMYGSTQATYLALKVITEYHKMIQSVRTGGDITVNMNQSVSTKSYQKDSKENIVFNEFVNELKEGGNELAIVFKNTSEPIPGMFNLIWNTKVPPTSAECKLKIETRLMKTEMKLNETVRLAVKLTNKTSDGLPMSMAVVGIPAGLSLQPWQMKELKEKEAFDFYEIIGDKLAIYYRELGPNQVKEINLDLKADLPGTFLSAASCAYLYYASEFRHWVEGSKVNVRR